jgi:hypothetical protein
MKIGNMTRPYHTQTQEGLTAMKRKPTTNTAIQQGIAIQDRLQQVTGELRKLTHISERRQDIWTRKQIKLLASERRQLESALNAIYQ